MGQRLILTADDGHPLGAYRADASGTARGGIVVLQEIFGVNAHIREVCDGFATDGFTSIAPALYDRSSQRDCELGYESDNMAVGRGLREEFSWDDSVKDVAAAVAVLAGEGLEVGSVGYCWAGTISFLAGTRLDVSAAVVYYGGQILPTRRRGHAAPCSCTSASTTRGSRSLTSSRSRPRTPRPLSTSTTRATASTATTVEATTNLRRGWRESGPSSSSTRVSREHRLENHRDIRAFSKCGSTDSFGFRILSTRSRANIIWTRTK